MIFRVIDCYSQQTTAALRAGTAVVEAATLLTTAVSYHT